MHGGEWHEKVRSWSVLLHRRPLNIFTAPGLIISLARSTTTGGGWTNDIPESVHAYI